MRRLLTIARVLFPAIVACALWAAPQQASAQGRSNIGPGKCGDCHDHEDEKDWSQKRDGDGKGKLHLNAKKQLDDPDAAKYATAIGLTDQYDVKGTCVKCHATVVRGRASFGVSCESCHGPGSDYLAPHQEKGAYDKAVCARHAGRAQEARDLGQGLPRLSRARRQPERSGSWRQPGHPTGSRLRRRREVQAGVRTLAGRDEVHRESDCGDRDSDSRGPAEAVAGGDGREGRTTRGAAPAPAAAPARPQPARGSGSGSRGTSARRRHRALRRRRRLQRRLPRRLRCVAWSACRRSACRRLRRDWRRRRHRVEAMPRCPSSCRRIRSCRRRRRELSPLFKGDWWRCWQRC